MSSIKHNIETENCDNYQFGIFNHRGRMYSYITKLNINQELLCNKFPHYTVTLLYSLCVWVYMDLSRIENKTELNEEKYSKNNPREQRSIMQVWETWKEDRRETMKMKEKEYWSGKDQRQCSLVWKHQKNKKDGRTEMNKMKQSKKSQQLKKKTEKGKRDKVRKVFLWCPQFGGSFLIRTQNCAW